ncbi:MAG: hypothetical protein O3C40_15310 [Planctomycetota bacterium]|nr:hypothetical protein [Planctomycetota bacterium]
MFGTPFWGGTACFIIIDGELGIYAESRPLEILATNIKPCCWLVVSRETASSQQSKAQIPLNIGQYVEETGWPGTLVRMATLLGPDQAVGFREFDVVFHAM